MKLRALLLAEHASTDASGKLYVHGGGITRLMAPIPSAFPFLTFLAQFLVEEDDLGQTFSAQVRVTDAQGEPLGDIPAQTMGPIMRKGEPGEDQTYTVAMTFGGLPLTSAGRYEFEIALEDETVAGLGVLVIPVESEE